VIDDGGCSLMFPVDRHATGGSGDQHGMASMDDPCADDHIPPILPWFTFNKGRHART